MPDISVGDIKEVEAAEAEARDERDHSSLQDEKLSDDEIAAGIRESLRGRRHSDSAECYVRTEHADIIY